jgi:phospholipid/cholesterol/gamma-HCH transport system substrate-binding protein
VAIVVVAFLMFGGGSDYTVTVTFQNAGQLVKGNLVQVAGRPIGKVKSIALDDNAQAKVQLSVGSGFNPLHEGTTAVIRAASLSGIANRYVELHPGPNSAPKIDDGGRIGADKTQAPVDLDQLFNTLDPKTRKGLQNIVQGGATQYKGKAAKAAAALHYFNPAISTSARVTRELVLDRVAFQRFVANTAETVSALDERRGDLAALVGNANTTAKAIGDENVALELGPNNADKIPDGGEISAENSTAPVDLDQLFNTLDPKTRKGLQGIIQGGAQQYKGKSAQAAAALHYFNPALSTSARVARELVLDRQSFQRFVTNTAETVSALDARRSGLGGLALELGCPALHDVL